MTPKEIARRIKAINLELRRRICRDFPAHAEALREERAYLRRRQKAWTEENMRQWREREG